MLDASIVVPTYNRLRELQIVLPSLTGQDLSGDRYEVLICDSNSTDGTAEYVGALAAQGANVRHIAGPFSGRAMARNAGIAAARGDIILFNDSDIIASPDLLATHLQRHRGEQHIAAVGCEVQVKSLDDYADKRDHPERRYPLHPPSRKRLSWLYFLTGNASVRREDLMRVGGFDESFTGYGHEDLELGYRLQKAGVTIVYEPRAVNYHWQDIAHEDQIEKMKLAGRSTVRFYRKHPDFAVMLNLGMTPISLGVHTAVSKLPWVQHALNRRAPHSKIAQALVQQYHYISGIKSALAERGE